MTTIYQTFKNFLIAMESLSNDFDVQIDFAFKMLLESCKCKITKFAIKNARSYVKNKV